MQSKPPFTSRLVALHAIDGLVLVSPVVMLANLNDSQAVFASTFSTRRAYEARADGFTVAPIPSLIRRLQFRNRSSWRSRMSGAASPFCVNHEWITLERAAMT